MEEKTWKKVLCSKNSVTICLPKNSLSIIHYTISNRSSWLLPSAGCFWNLLTSFYQIWKQTQDQISSSHNAIPHQHNQLLVEDTQIHMCYVEKAGIKTHILTTPKGSSQSVHSSNPSHGMCSCMASKRGRRQGRHCRGKEEKDKVHKSSRK